MIDVVTIGETMAMVTPSSPVSLASTRDLTLRIGGAESNVAGHLAGLGWSTRHLTRVGDDPLGQHVLAWLRDAAVDTGSVVVDPDAPTGVYFKDPAPDGSRAHYYRRGSAASRMDVEVVGDAGGARIVHLTGVTAALSPSCLELTRAVVVGREIAGALVSFDVNHREVLWSAADAGPLLAELADASDLVFVGLDEAERLWGVTTPGAVREILPTPATVVVKDGAVAAHAIGTGGTVSVPALRVEVVEPVGAGDAFAAGYLDGVLSGADTVVSLRTGHLAAGHVLGVLDDVAPLPPRAWFDERTSLPDDAWAALEVLSPRA